MSILLDALKKSEAQRQLGEIPTLQTPVMSDQQSAQNNHSWLPLFMTILAAALIIWIGSVQFRPPALTEFVTTTDTPVLAEGTEPPGAAAATDANSESVSGRSIDSPVKNFVADKQEASSPSVPPTAVRTVSESAVETISREGAELSSDAIQRRNARAARRDPGKEQFANAESSGSGAMAEGQQMAPYSAEPLSYWQMPQSLRESLPELRITVLVFAESPEDRFLLMNGERLKENDEVSSGLVLEEIQRDRAIFSYRDYRFHVKS